MKTDINWNSKVKLILSDVDETVADLYLPAKPEMITELSRLLEENKVIFFITGQGLEGVNRRITNKIEPSLRHNILISHSGGAEVWSFEKSGDLRTRPEYSLYEEKMDDTKRKLWRELVQQLITEFKLITYPATPITEFKFNAGNNPNAIMLEDRGPQITMEFINGSSTLREPVFKMAEILFKENDLPVFPRYGGMFALDLVIEGASKTTAIKHLLDNHDKLAEFKMTPEDVSRPEFLEIWGDRYSINVGSDRYMCEAVDPRVRAIDFREEDPEELPKGYNIRIWKGEKHLHDGLLEYLQNR